MPNPEFKHISDGINIWDVATPIKFATISIDSVGSYPSTMGDDSQQIINVIQAYKDGNITISSIPSANLVSWVAAGYAVFIRIFMSGFGGSGYHQTEYGILTSNGAGTPGSVWVNYGNGGKLYFSFNATYTGFQGTNAVSGQINRINKEDIDNLSYPGMCDVGFSKSDLMDGDVLTWSANADKWVAQQPGGGGGSGSQLPVIIDVGRVIHQNGVPQNVIADVPQNNYYVPFDRQIIFTYRAYEQGGMYAKYWTVTPDAYKLALDNGGVIMSNYEDLHWIVEDMINNQLLPLQQDVEYRLMMYKTISNAVYCIEIPLWISIGTTATEIEFYLDSTGFSVRQVQYIGADN